MVRHYDMTARQLHRVLADQTGLPAVTVKQVLEAFRDTIHSLVMDQGLQVTLSQVGTFRRRWSSGARAHSRGYAATPRYRLALKGSKAAQRFTTEEGEEEEPRE